MKGQKTVGWIVAFFLIILFADLWLTSIGGYDWTITAQVRKFPQGMGALIYAGAYFWLLWWPPKPIADAWLNFPKFRDVIAALTAFLGGHLFFP